MKKKLLSVILAVAVAFTFSFAMVGTASAETSSPSIEYSDDFSTVTLYTADGVNVGTYKTLKTATVDSEAGEGWDGEIDATIDPSVVNDFDFEAWGETGDTGPVHAAVAYAASDVAQYIDFTNAAVYIDNIGYQRNFTGGLTEILSKLNASGIYDIEKVKFFAPSDVYAVHLFDYDKDVAIKAAEVDVDDLGEIGLKKATVDLSGIDATSFAAQTVSAVPEFKFASTEYSFLNMDKAATVVINIAASTPTADYATFTVDDEVLYTNDDIKDPCNNTFTYDGATHEIEMYPMDGVTVSYQQWDRAEAKFVDIDKATFTDACATDNGEYEFKAIVKDNKNTVEYYIPVHVNRADVKIGFKDDYLTLEKYFSDINAVFNDIGGDIIGNNIITEAADGLGLMVIEEEDYDTENILAATAVANESQAASKKALEANADLVNEYIKDTCEVTEQSSTKLYGQAYGEYKAQALNILSLGYKTPDDLDAFSKKYDQLQSNIKFTFKGEKLSVMNAIGLALIVKAPEEEIVAVEDSVSFDGVVAKQVYKNKSGKLKAKKTINAAATADSGKDVYYKLTKSGNSKITIDPNTGVITVKAGLKKGTYNVIVKGYTKDSAEYKAAYEEHPITIKVKKSK